MLQERSQTNAENASRPLMNGADVESNTVNQPSSSNYRKITKVVVGSIIGITVLGVASAFALWGLGFFGGDNTPNNFNSLTARNITNADNGTTPAYTNSTNSGNNTSYFSDILDGLANNFRNAMYSQSQRFISEAPTTPEPCSDEAIEDEMDYIKQNIGALNTTKGIDTLSVYMEDCYQGRKRN